MLSLSFLRANARLLAFGVLMTFCSSLGQTFFISLFSGEIRTAFALSDGDFGSLYAVATLGSAAVLLWAGRLIDRLPLPVFAGATVTPATGLPRWTNGRFILSLLPDHRRRPD